MLPKPSKFLYLLIFGFVEFIFLTASEEASEDYSHENCSCAPPVTTFHTAAAEKWTLKNTGCSLEIVGNPDSKGTVSGGSLSQEFAFYEFLFYWCDNGHHKYELEVFDFFYNKEFGSFEEALAAGQVILSVIPIKVFGWTPNPVFVPFLVEFQKIKTAGSSIPVASLPTYKFFATFPPDAVLKTSKGSFTDPKTGKEYPNVQVISLPPQPINYISIGQYYATFKQLGYENPPPKIQEVPPVKELKGIKVTFDAD